MSGIVHLFIFFPLEDEGEEDVVFKGEGVQQVKILEDKPQVVPAEGRQLPLGKFGEGGVPEDDLPGSRPVEGGEDV